MAILVHEFGECVSNFLVFYVKPPFAQCRASVSLKHVPQAYVSGVLVDSHPYPKLRPSLISDLVKLQLYLSSGKALSYFEAQFSETRLIAYLSASSKDLMRFVLFRFALSVFNFMIFVNFFSCRVIWNVSSVSNVEERFLDVSISLGFALDIFPVFNSLLKRCFSASIFVKFFLSSAFAAPSLSYIGHPGLRVIISLVALLLF